MPVYTVFPYQVFSDAGQAGGTETIGDEFEISNRGPFSLTVDCVSESGGNSVDQITFTLQAKINNTNSVLSTDVWVNLMTMVISQSAGSPNPFVAATTYFQHYNPYSIAHGSATESVISDTDGTDGTVGKVLNFRKLRCAHYIDDAGGGLWQATLGVFLVF